MPTTVVARPQPEGQEPASPVSVYLAVGDQPQPKATLVHISGASGSGDKKGFYPRAPQYTFSIRSLFQGQEM